MGEGPPSMREGRGWGVSIFITCWQGVAPSPVRRWSRQAAWPWHREVWGPVTSEVPVNLGGPVWLTGATLLLV